MSQFNRKETSDLLSSRELLLQEIIKADENFAREREHVGHANADGNSEDEDRSAKNVEEKVRPEDAIPDRPENKAARDFLKNAPSKGLWLPMGVEVKVMQCWRCKAYGHRTGDRECPLYTSGNILLDAERQAREDPMAKFLATKEDKRSDKDSRRKELEQLLKEAKKEEKKRKKDKKKKIKEAKKSSSKHRSKDKRHKRKMSSSSSSSSSATSDSDSGTDKRRHRKKRKG